jgi:hypothetical protein
MQPRKTFEQETRDILTDARLGSIVSGDVPVTEYNWTEAADEVVAHTNRSVQRLVADLALATGKNIVLSRQFAPPRWKGEDGPLKMRANFTWEHVLKAYPNFINGTINNINYSHQYEFTSFPLHPLKWQKGMAFSYIPDETERMNHNVTLAAPEEYTGDDLPDHFRAKLDLLKHTHYDFQPYVLRDAAGPHMLLCLRLGCQWRDIVIASHKHPPLPQKLNIGLLFAIFACFALCFGGWYGGFFTEVVWAKWALTLAAGLSGVLGALLASTLISKKFKPLKV